jgi:hypothetical protein
MWRCRSPARGETVPGGSPVRCRRRGRCFCDAGEQIGLRGKYLAGELPAIYGESAAAVVFASAGYAARGWTRFEAEVRQAVWDWVTGGTGGPGRRSGV